jgi:hypothetical protein
VKVYSVTVRYAKGLESKKRILARNPEHARSIAKSECGMIPAEKITVHREKADAYRSA